MHEDPSRMFCFAFYRYLKAVEEEAERRRLEEERAEAERKEVVLNIHVLLFLCYTMMSMFIFVEIMTCKLTCNLLK